MDTSLFVFRKSGKLWKMAVPRQLTGHVWGAQAELQSREGRKNVHCRYLLHYTGHLQ